LKTIILYGRRNTGLLALSYLKARGFNVKVISDDKTILWLAESLGCDIVDFNSMGEFDLFLCVHGNRILPKEILQKRKMVNVHPCLGLYKGANPIKKYIKNKDTKASVESHWMIEEVDAGEVIHQEFFETGIIHSYAEFYNQCIDKYFKCIDRTLKKVL